MSLSFPGPASSSALRALQQTSTRLDRTFAQLGSGKRIASASDDAAGLATALRFSAQVLSYAQGERNLADGRDLVQVADGALQGSQDAIARMRELSVQASNGTLSTADRATLQDEYDQLAQQVTQTAGGTQFGGRALLDGSASGGGAVQITDGQGGSTAIDIPDLGAAALGIGGLDVGDPATRQALDAASAQVSSVRGQLGARDAQFERSASALGNARANTAEARSRIEDVDVALSVASLTRDRILQSLQLATLASSGKSQRLMDKVG